VYSSAQERHNEPEVVTVTNATLPKLTSQGLELDTSAESFGLLRDSTDVLEDTGTLRERMAEDGYLYLPSYLDRDLVLEARKSVTERLAAEGLTDSGYSADEAVAHPDSGLKFKPDLAHDNEPLHRLLYGGRMMEFYGRFFGGPVRHYDFTWMRAVAPGSGVRSYRLAAPPPSRTLPSNWTSAASPLTLCSSSTRWRRRSCDKRHRMSP
jgi:hypothetical protein